jgi:hypothetical protein
MKDNQKNIINPFKLNSHINNKSSNERLKNKWNLFLNKKVKSRNNNLLYLKADFRQKYFASKLKNEITNHVNNINITDDINKSNNKSTELKKINLTVDYNIKNKETYKNKSNDDLPKPIKKNNIISLLQKGKQDINENQNPINVKNYFLFDDIPDNKSNKSIDKIKTILNKRKKKKCFILGRNLLTNNSNNKSDNTSLNTSNFTSDILKNKIEKILKDISPHKHKYKSEILYTKNTSKIIPKVSSKYKLNKNRNKSIDYFAKRNKNKIINLLNREGALNNFLKSMKIKTTHNFFKSRKKPKSSFEMNRLLINTYGLNRQKHNEFSEQLYSLNENYFSVMNKMRKERAEIDQRNFDEKRNSNSSSLSFEIMRENELQWEKKFMENINKNKLTEEEYNEYKNINKIKQKKRILKHSEKFADYFMNIKMDEFEYPNDFNAFNSSGNQISFSNINRISKMKKIMKDIEEKEQFKIMDLNLEQLKNNQKKSEEEGVLAINRAGKPRFVKTKFKQSTILKFKGVSGEYFGVPA